MNRVKWFLLGFALALLLFFSSVVIADTAGAPVPVVRLKANQAVTVLCIEPPVDEILLDPHGDGGGVDVTCRVYVEGE